MKKTIIFILAYLSLTSVLWPAVIAPKSPTRPGDIMHTTLSDGQNEPGVYKSVQKPFSVEFNRKLKPCQLAVGSDGFPNYMIYPTFLFKTL